MKYVAFYGNLLSSLPNKRPYLDAYISKVSECFLEGNLYDADNDPAFIPVKNNKIVKAELYKVINQKALFIIDDFVGYKRNDLANSPYYRLKMPLYHSKLSAYVYIYNKDIDNYEYIENGDWLDYYNKKYNKAIFNSRNYEKLALNPIY